MLKNLVEVCNARTCVVKGVLLLTQVVSSKSSVVELGLVFEVIRREWCFVSTELLWKRLPQT